MTSDDADRVWMVRSAAIENISQSFYSEDEINTWLFAEKPNEFEKVITSLEWYVAEIDSVIVGTGFVDIDTKEVGAIFVHPDYQRKGIGLAILKKLEEVARSNSLDELHIESTLNAEQFYRTVGFESEGRQQYNHVSGLKLACIKMTKRIS